MRQEVVLMIVIVKDLWAVKDFFRSNDNLRTCHAKEEYYYKK